ncbi:MAG: NADH-quinone oxidoreductase subunit J [Acidimicrobiales bacterium]
MIHAGILAIDIGDATFGAPDFFFAIIAIVSVVAALKMVATNNVVHSALYLLVVLSAVAGLYIMLGAEFVAATQVLVYIGAIMVLLLFGVMLTRTRIGEETDLNHDQRWIGGLISTAMFAVMGYALWDQFGSEALPAERVIKPNRSPTQYSATTSCHSRPSRYSCWLP